MPRQPIDTGARCCEICGESFYRKKYMSNKYEDTARFFDRHTCEDPECIEEYRSRKHKEIWDKRKGVEKKTIEVPGSDPVSVWLSSNWSNLNSVRKK